MVSRGKTGIRLLLTSSDRSLSAAPRVAAAGVVRTALAALLALGMSAATTTSLLADGQSGSSVATNEPAQSDSSGGPQLLPPDTSVGPSAPAVPSAPAGPSIVTPAPAAESNAPPAPGGAMRLETPPPPTPDLT